MHQVSRKIGSYRWSIVALLFFATTINYMDRQVIGYLKPLFSLPVDEGGLGWSNTDYAIVTSTFTMCYAIVTFGVGFIIDKIGAKIGLALSLSVWTLFGILNAFAGSSVLAHTVFRSLFGMGEAGNFPASIKAVTEWFPPKERALATGIFNSGSNFGAMITSIVVPLITYKVWFDGAVQGWQMSFIITGSIGILWLFFWFKYYDKPSQQKRLSQAEYEYIIQTVSAVKNEQGENESGNSDNWYKLLINRRTCAFILLRFLTDGIWWFLLFWLPDFMKQQFNMEGQAIMLPLFIVYGISIAGSVLGGSLSIPFINRGMEPFKAKFMSMLLIAILPLSLLLIQYLGDTNSFGSDALWLALGIIAIAAAAHQAWAANMFATISDLFPSDKVASVTGIGGLAGGLGGIIIQLVAGVLTDYWQMAGRAVVESSHMVGHVAQELIQSYVQYAYSIMFAYCACAYLLAWGIMKLSVSFRKSVE